MAKNAKITLKLTHHQHNAVRAALGMAIDHSNVSSPGEATGDDDVKWHHLEGAYKAVNKAAPPKPPNKKAFPTEHDED